MKVVAALDSFKGSLDSLAAGRAVRSGVLSVAPDAEVVVRAVADGGEGTLGAMLEAAGGHALPVPAVDALGRPVVAEIGVLERDGRRTAIVEAARTIGLHTVGTIDAGLPPRASSYGLGLHLRAAVAQGVDRVLVALGGTATTDGGTGLLAAVGAPVLDERGRPVGPADGNPLWFGTRLGDAPLPVIGPELHVLTDVANPLVGPDGAANVFGPQKGATAHQVRLLDEHMAAWAVHLERAAGRAIAAVPGSGAAGGIAAALLALGGVLRPGFDAVAEETDLAGALSGARLVFTGEGSVDAQTAWGKAPAGVARLARRAGAVVVALGGRVERPLPGDVFDAILPIHSRPRPLAEAVAADATTAELAATAAEVTRLVSSLQPRRIPPHSVGAR